MRVAQKIAAVGKLITAGIAVSGCAGSGGGFYGGPVIDPASVVQVNRELQIPDSKARVFLFDGMPTDSRPGTFRTYCSVLMQNLHKPGEPLLKVLPGRFEIEQVREYNDLRSAPRIYVASIKSRFEDWPANIVYSVELRLHSDTQPDVRALICSRHSGAEMYPNARRYYPTREEIDLALGDYIDIQLP